MEIRALILVVDDQPELLSSLQMTLELSGYGVVTAHNGHIALELLHQRSVDLIISDIAMPGMNGYQLYERVRENAAWMAIPFLFLTARSLDSDVRYGKELGVDDYLTKPLQPEDLLAVIQGKLKRARQLQHPGPRPAAPTVVSSQLVHGRVVLDAQQHRAWYDGTVLNLSAREFTILEYLMQRPEIVVAARDMVEITHELQTDDDEASMLLRPLIRSLRRKLGYAVGETGCIENVRGVGYRLTKEVASASLNV